VSVASRARRSLALGALGVQAARARVAGAGADAARQLVAARLGDLRGLPQKIGQILSLAEIESGDTLYTPLTEGGRAVSGATATAWIEAALGRPIGDAFARFDEGGVAASLGQVHRAVLHDGRVVAVKVQFPEVAETVDTDLAALGVIASPLLAGRTGFDLAAYREELRRALVTELDYRAEAAALRRFARYRREVPGLETPDPIDRLCAPRVLTMTWIDGEGIAAARRWPRAAREAAATVLVQTFLRGCFAWGEVHADPHAGNLRFARRRHGATVGLIDFGCTRSIEPREQRALWRLAAHGDTLAAPALAEAWADLGFPPAVTDGLRHRLAAITGILFEPFHRRGPFDARAWQPAERLAAALGDDRWTFRTAGPASLLYVIRAFQGLLVYARALDAPVDWREALHALPEPASAAAPAATTPVGTATTPAPPLQAAALRVLVTRAGDTVASIRMPAAAVAHLAELMPADLQPRLARTGVSLAQLARDTIARGGPPGDVVTLDDGGDRVRVWLE